MSGMVPQHFQRPPGRQKITKFIYQLDGRSSEELIDLLNINENWKSLALAIDCSQVQIQKFENRMYQHGGSPAKAIFDFLCSKNTDVEKMFLLLHKIELYRGMDLLKEYVNKDLHELIRQGPVLSPEMTKQTPVIPPTNLYRNPVKLNQVNSAGGGYNQPVENDTRSMNLSTAQMTPEYLMNSANTNYAGSPRLNHRNQHQPLDQQYLLQQQQQYLQQRNPQQQSPAQRVYQHQQQVPHQIQQTQNLPNYHQQNPPNYLQVQPQQNQHQFGQEHQQYYQQLNGQQPGLGQRRSPLLRNNRSPVSPAMLGSEYRDIPGSVLQAPQQQIIGTSPNQTNGTRSRYPSTCCTNNTNTSTTSNNSCINNLTRVTIEELTEATDNWKASNKLGNGGYGEVFRGKWHHQDVAIKRIRRDTATKNSDKQLSSFSKEVEFLNSNKSEFILAIIAFCDNPADPCIVTQFIRNGSLDDRLKCKNGSFPLKWMTRYNIAAGTANGLQFIHSKKNASGIRLVHGDIKPGNILLDQNMIPKIADFGLAREMNVDQSVVIVSQISGTQFYLPIEYIQTRTLKTKVDTYSFGVVLFDIITGKPPNYKSDKSKPYLIEVLRETDVNILDFVDKHIPINQEENATNIVKILYEYGLRCTRDKAKDRPEMEEVYIKLSEALKTWELQMHYDSIKSQKSDGNVPMMLQKQQQVPILPGAARGQQGQGHQRQQAGGLQGHQRQQAGDLQGQHLQQFGGHYIVEDQQRQQNIVPQVQRISLDPSAVGGLQQQHIQKVGLHDVGIIRGGDVDQQQQQIHRQQDSGQNSLFSRITNPDLLTISSMSQTNLPQPMPLSMTANNISLPPSSNIKINNSYRVQPTLDSSSSSHMNRPTTINQSTDQLIRPTTINQSTDHQLIGPTTINQSTDQLIRPTTINQSTDQLIRPTTINQSTDRQLIGPTTINQSTDQLIRPTTINQSTNQLVRPPSLNISTSNRSRDMAVPLTLLNSSSVNQSINQSMPVTINSGSTSAITNENDPVPDFEDLMNSQSTVINSGNFTSSVLNTESSMESNVEDSARFSTLDDLASDYAEMNLEGW